MEMFQKALLVVTIIGAVNWGMIGLLDFNLVAFLFGSSTMFERIIYALVGISGIINIGLLMAHLDFKRD
ncbi:MAG: DUF378 domain-containing protein [Bacilli bacterium]|nr:DUF378 domain-containing protein [Bacilli bacterium]